MTGRSLQRSLEKAILALTLGLVSGSDPVSNLGRDAAQEPVTKAIPRSLEDDESRNDD